MPLRRPTMKLTMPDGRDWVNIRAEGPKYYIGKKRYSAVEIGAMAGVTASALRNRAHRYGIDFATAFNAPSAKEGNTHLQQLEMERYLKMLEKWPEYPMRKPNGAAPPKTVEPLPRPQMLFEPRQKPQEVDVRVTVVGDQDANVTAMRVSLDHLVELARCILSELRELNSPPLSARREPREIEESDPETRDMD